MEIQNYFDEINCWLNKAFICEGYKITENLALDVTPESSNYDGVTFSIDNKRIVYRKGKVTTDRPGAFLAIWKRPSAGKGSKPIPLASIDLDYLFIHVENHPSVIAHNSSSGMFIFPVSLLINKGIVFSPKGKGKTGFRVFPPWTQDRGEIRTSVFSKSGKKTQQWQLPYFVEIDEYGLLDSVKLKNIFNPKKL